MNKVSTVLSCMVKVVGSALLVFLCFMAYSIKKDADSRAQAESGLKDAAIELKMAAHEVGITVIQLNAIDRKDANCKTTGCRTAIQEIIDNAAGISRMAYSSTKAQQDYWNAFPAKSDAIVSKLYGITDKLNTGIAGLNMSRIGEDIHGTFLEINGDKDNPGLIHSAQGVLITLTGTIGDLDSLAKDQDIKNSLASIAGIAEQLNLTSADLRKVADKYSAQLTAPMTKKQKVLAALDFVLRGLQVDYAIRLLQFKH